MTELISLIVPIYNVDRFLPRCVESIINQTYKDLEIILVDDGSTDNCPKICAKYKQLDSRIVILKKANGGLSSARNEGFRISTVKYVIYIDSDDFVKNTYVENLYEAISSTKADIAISNFCLTDEMGNILGRTKATTLEVETFSSQEALKQLLLQKKFDNSAWGKIYKREFFETVKYPEGKLYEDLPVTYQLFLKSRKIAYINSCDYFYVQRSNSILNMKFNLAKLDLVQFVEEMFTSLSIENPHLINYAGTRAFSALMSLWRTIPLEEKFNKKVWNEAIKYRKYPLKLWESKLKLKLGAVLTFVGVQVSNKLMSK